MLFGFNSREIWTWYLRPPRSRYEPSVSPWRVFGSLLPHPAAARARTATARDASSRRIGRGSLLRKARGRLCPAGPPAAVSAAERRARRGLARAARDRRSRAAAVVLLEDRLETAHRLAEVALRPAAGEALEEAVGGQLRLALEREAHVRAVARGALELVDADRAVPVVLAHAADLDDAARALGLDDRGVAPREAVQRRLALPPRAGAHPVCVLARQAPVDQVVVAELRVVGDVGEVLVDLLARAGDADLVDELHGRPRSLRGRRRPPPDGVAALGVRHDVRALRGLAVARAAQLAHDGATRVDVDDLADERRPSAVGAVAAARLAGPAGAPPRLAGPHALAKQLALEVGLGDAEQGPEHGAGFAARAGRSSPGRSPARRSHPAADRWSLAR